MFILGFGSLLHVISAGYSHEELDDADGGNGKYMQVERDHLLLLDVQAGLFDDCGMGILRALVEGTSELTACLFAPSSFVSSSRLLSHHPVFHLIIPSFVSSSHLLSRHPIVSLIIWSFVSSSCHCGVYLAHLVCSLYFPLCHNNISLTIIIHC